MQLANEIVSEGDLLNEHDEVLAAFRQRFRAWLGRPVLEIKIDLELKHDPTGYPWHSYFAARFGWRDDRVVLFRGVNGQNTMTGYTRPVSPDYLEVRLGAERSFLFTGGLPFLQRHGNRMADVILCPEGEQGRSFEMLLALGRWEPLRDLLLRVFKRQNSDGDWPQWFMFFERERGIRAGDSHGDIVFWPLVVLAQYLTASGDAALLDETVPFFDGRGTEVAERATVWQHVERALGLIERRVIPGTALAAYGSQLRDASHPRSLGRIQAIDTAAGAAIGAGMAERFTAYRMAF